MQDDQDSPDKKVQPGWFPQTSWTRVRLAQGVDAKSSVAWKALETLCSDYRKPVITAFRVKHGLSPDDAEDAGQEFLVEFLRNDLFAQADGTRGKFRTYLLTCLDFFAANRWRKEQALKRGGGSVHVSIDRGSVGGAPQPIEIPDDRTPDQEIAREWARSTLNAVRDRLKKEEIAAGREMEWAVLQEFLRISPGLSLDQAAAKMGIDLNATNVRVYRLRKRFREELNEQVSATVASKEEFDEEMALLRDVYS